MKLLKAIIYSLPALLCWQFFPCDGAVEKDIDTLWRVSAYCPCPKCCGQWSDGVTACGHVIEKGDFFVAADKSIPFGTLVIVPGYNEGKPVKVLDRGGAIKGNRLDVFFGDVNGVSGHQRALDWGIKYLPIKFYKKELQDG